MSVVARKVIRQELMPTTVLDKIEREPLPVNTDRVRRSPDGTREQAPGQAHVRARRAWGATSAHR